MANAEGVRFTAEVREEKRSQAVSLYADGYTMKDIAKALGCAFATVSVLLKESGVGTRLHTEVLPAGMITAKEAAELAGVRHPSFNSLRHRGEGPPEADRPAGAHQHYTYYWRKDVEAWASAREQRKTEARNRQQRREEAKRAARAEARAKQTVRYVPDWEGLMEALDYKREADDLTWEDVALAVRLDPGQMSRLKNGQHPPQGWSTYFRLCAWVQDGLPPELEAYVIPSRR